MTGLFLRTAAPIIMVMAVSGLLNVVDALFLGRFVGADALTAVTIVFPLFMILIAMSSLVGGGASSLIARALGAGDIERANRLFGSAQVLSFMMALLAIMLFSLIGEPLIRSAAGDRETIVQMSLTYIVPLILAAPLTFILSLQYDTLRSEGRIGLMSTLAMSVTLLNIVLNGILIVGFGLGVFGSVLGTILAQVLSFSIIVYLRARGKDGLRLFTRPPLPDWKTWRAILALGLPSSLNFIGVSLLASVVIYSVNTFGEDHIADTIAAYGVIQRVNTFAFLPLLGLSLAAQTIIGNNVGAEKFDRSNKGVLIALGLGVSYAFFVELVILVFSRGIGTLFISDPAVVGEVARIFPIIILLFPIFGFTTILSGYFQAIGDAKRAAIFGLAQIYLFTAPLTLVLPRMVGEMGIWTAVPVAHFLMFVFGGTILAYTWKTKGRRFGLFLGETAGPAVTGPLAVK